MHKVLNVQECDATKASCIYNCRAHKIYYFSLTVISFIYPETKKIYLAHMAKAKKKDEPIILITNDDGISSPGIKALVESVKGLGKIVVVAPDKPQSGMGHAITIGHPLRLHSVQAFGDIEAYQ